MAMNRVLCRLNTLLITRVSTNNVPEEDCNFQITSLQDILLDHIWKNLDELAHILPNFFAYLGDKLNEIFPPEMRHEVWQWILLTALPFVIDGLILLACLYLFCLLLCLILLACLACLYCLFEFLLCFMISCWWIVRGVIFICVQCFNCFMICCRWVVGGVKYICYQRGRGGGSAAVKMMKAPGRGGALIARSQFEAGSKAYFKSLRAGRPLK